MRLQILTAVTVGVLVGTAVTPLDAQIWGKKKTADSTPANGFVVSKLAKDALDQQYDKKWSLASISPQSASCLADSAAAKQFVEGDFNSDGQSDIAALLKVGNSVKLVVIFNRAEDAVITELDTLGESTADGYLTVRRRGDQFQNPGDSLHDYFVVDTVAVSRCGQPQTVYFWSGAAFRKSTLS
jgi:hypothetical protein